LSFFLFVFLSFDISFCHLGLSSITLYFYIVFLHSILFYSIILYSILFYSILFYSILFYSILFYSILFYSILLLSFIASVLVSVASSEADVASEGIAGS
jgi:hypothetical protein